MNTPRPRMLFVSPVFLFPTDTGGRIRTTNILRGLEGGAFDVTLACPASSEQRATWSAQIDTLCNRLVAWTPAPQRPRWTRVRHLLHGLPVNVLADRNPTAVRAVRQAVEASSFDVVVFDFVHAAVLRPSASDVPSVCFTHNVEAEIFERHAHQSRRGLMRTVWRSQARKMRRFESAALTGFDAVIAVSERDAAAFRDRYGVRSVSVIPTAVDLDYFAWKPQRVAPDAPPTIVFTGSMDWDANIDGVRHFLRETWPRIREREPRARFVVVGRHPPGELVEAGRSIGGVEFTGWVEDVRPYVYGADVFVVPLRVGGGTRIKVFEAMAMGCPVVSTNIGIEGLDVQPGEHYELQDDAHAFANVVLELLADPVRRRAVAGRARHIVETRFGHRAVASVFEQACLGVLRPPVAARANVAIPNTRGARPC